MRVRWQIPAILIAAGAGLTGCDSTDPSGDLINYDAAVVASDGALEDLEMMHGPRLGLGGVVFPALIGGRPDCPKTQDVFLCDPVERAGIEYTRAITYRDAGGAAQDAYEEATTSSIEYLITVHGERGREGWSASIDRARDFGVTGLIDGGGAVTWNGTMTGSVTRSRHFDEGEGRSYEIQSIGSVNDVVVPFPRADDSWPLSGTISRSLTITRSNGSESETRDKNVTITFNGTSQVEVTVDGETFTLDLTQRMRPGRHMHRRGGRGGPGGRPS
jgi:hypothetical protein